MSEHSPDDRPEQPPMRLADAGALAGDLIGPTVVGVIVDWQAGTKPTGTLVGFAVGLVVFGYHLMKVYRRLSGSDRRE